MTNQMDAPAQETNATDANSALVAEDLDKALDAVSTLIKSGAIGREQELLAKSMTGAASVEEKAELATILSGTKVSPIAKAVSEPLAPERNETFKKSIDASEYISTLHNSLVTSFGAVAKALQSSDESRERETVVLAKALLEIGKMVAANAKLTKSLEQRLNEWGKQPARGPKSQTPMGMASAQPVQKGLGERTGEGAAVIQPAQANQMNRQSILDGLTYLAQSNGPSNFSKSGESYAEAVSKFESSNEIHPILLQEVMQLIGSNRGAQA